MSGTSSHQALRDVIASAIWRRVTDEDGTTDWDDLWPVDRAEFEQDADEVLASLVAEGYSTPQLLEPGQESPEDNAAAAIDVLAREALYRIVFAGLSIDEIANPSVDGHPNVTQQGRTALVQRVRERAEAVKPDPAALLDAYECLAATADVPEESHA